MRGTGIGATRPVYLVRLVVQLLKCLGVEHTDEEIEVIVTVRDHAKDSLLTLSQLGKLQIIFVGNVLDLRRNEASRTAALTKMDFAVCPPPV